MLDFNLLEESQINSLNKIHFFDYFKADCEITDFAVLLGGFSTLEAVNNRLYGEYFITSSDQNSNTFKVVNSDGQIEETNKTTLHTGIRPSIRFSSMDMDNIYGNTPIKSGSFGEYPQSIVDEDLSMLLESIYNLNGYKTGKVYHVDGKIYDEYIYQNNKYIRVLGNFSSRYSSLSDGRKVVLDYPYWVRVEPIKWYIDEASDLAISKKILLAGFAFENSRLPFIKSEIKMYLDDFFSYDILTEEYSYNITNNYNEKKESNIYNFNYDSVSEEDIIKGCIKSNIAVFLHGKSGDGKSARVKELDPNLEIIYLRNATPDSLNGKSVYNANTGEMIDLEPTWYKNLVRKCEEEPNKFHVLFFDELTNALPSIQGMAFNIILDKEVNGKFKLPKNARIVAAGNDLDESLAANKLAEPLFNRFAHVYIDTTFDNWLSWALTPNDSYENLDYIEEEKHQKIHPSIYGYIAYNKNALRTPFNGERPNADPRKWEMASKLLYVTKQPEMLRALVGEELTANFIEFTKINFITLEQVLNHTYDPSYISIMNLSEKYATALNLSSVDEEHFEIVDNFMRLLGKEARAAFESIWAKNDLKRLEIIQEIRLQEQTMEDNNYKKLVHKIMNMHHSYRGDN